MPEIQNVHASDGTLLRAGVPTGEALKFLREHVGPRVFITVDNGRINAHRGEPKRPYTADTAVAYAVLAGKEA